MKLLSRTLPGVVVILLLLVFGAGCRPEGGGGVAGSVVNTVFGGPHPGSQTLIIDENSITVEALTASTAILRWDTNVPATSTVEYGDTERYTNTTAEDPALVLRHARDLYTLKYNHRYHFRCVSTDVYKNLAVSKDYVLTTREQNFAPKAVTLATPTGVTEGAATLTWTVSEDLDFKSYSVRYDLTDAVALNSYLAAGSVITDKLRTSCTVTGLIADRDYWFRVYVRDTLEAETGSNIVAARTLIHYVPPEPVRFLAPARITTTSLTIAWTEYTKSDFARYRVYRSTVPGFKPGLTAEIEITNPKQTTWEDTGRTPNTTYYYKVYVENQGGYLTSSEEGAFRTYAVGERVLTLPGVYSAYDILRVKSEYWIASFKALLVFNPAEGAIVAEIPSMGYNGLLVKGADEERLYVTSPTYDELRVVDTTKRRIVDTVKVASRPQSVTLDPAELRLFVPSFMDQRLYVLDRASLRTLAIVPTGVQPFHCAFGINQPLVVVANSGTTSVSLFRSDTLESSGEVQVGSAPSLVVPDLGGQIVYVVCRGDNAIARVSLVTGALVDRITVGRGPSDIKIADSGRRMYVCCSDDNAVEIYDLPAMTKRGAFATGPDPRGIEVTPDEYTVYVVNYGDDTLTAHQVQ